MLEFSGLHAWIAFLRCMELLGTSCRFIERFRSHNPAKIIFLIFDKKIVVEDFSFHCLPQNNWRNYYVYSGLCLFRQKRILQENIFSFSSKLIIDVAYGDLPDAEQNRIMHFEICRYMAKIGSWLPGK